MIERNDEQITRPARDPRPVAVAVALAAAATYAGLWLAPLPHTFRTVSGWLAVLFLAVAVAGALRLDRVANTRVAYLYGRGCTWLYATPSRRAAVIGVQTLLSCYAVFDWGLARGVGIGVAFWSATRLIKQP